MGIADLRESVEQRAREQVAAVRRDAAERAERLLAEARAERERRREADLERERAVLRREAVARQSDARRAAREQVLRSREALLERVFAAARRAADADPALQPAPGVIAARVGDALTKLPVGPVTFTCSPELAEAVEASLRERADATVEIDPALSPGFVARGAEGRLEVDARWEALLEQRRSELSIEVLRRLGEAEAR